MKKIAVMAFAAAALSGCAARGPVEPEVRIKEVLIEKPVACIPAATPAAPAYPDTNEALSAAPTPEERFARVLAGRLLRAARLEVLEPLVAACRETGQ